jgi:hypothetical protein
MDLLAWRFERLTEEKAVIFAESTNAARKGRARVRACKTGRSEHALKNFELFCQV